MFLVILTPYGLEAKLSGVSYRSHDPVAKKLLEEWKMFYPLGSLEDANLVSQDELFINLFMSYYFGLT